MNVGPQKSQKKKTNPKQQQQQNHCTDLEVTPSKMIVLSIIMHEEL